MTQHVDRGKHRRKQRNLARRWFGVWIIGGLWLGAPHVLVGHALAQTAKTTHVGNNSPLVQAKQQAETAVGKLRCSEADRHVKKYKELAKNKTGKNVIELEKKLTECKQKQRNRANELVSDAQEFINKENWGKADQVLGRFQTMESGLPRELVEQGDELQKQVDNVWMEVSKQVHLYVAHRMCTEAQASLDSFGSHLKSGHPHRKTLWERLRETVEMCKAEQTQVVRLGTTGDTNESQRSDDPSQGNTANTLTQAEGTLDPRSAEPEHGVVDTTEPESNAVVTAGWVTFGVGVAAGIAGGVLWGLGSKDVDTLQSSQGGPESPLAAITRSEALDLADDAEWKINSGIGITAVGAAAIVTGVILLALPDSENTPTVGFSPVDGGTAFVWGRW